MANKQRKRYAENAESLRAISNKWKAANREHLRQYRQTYKARDYEKYKIWAAANHELVLQSERRWRAKNSIRRNEARRANKIECPLCSGPMSLNKSIPAIMCHYCQNLLKLMENSKRTLDRTEMTEFIKTLTKGELEIWQSAITLRKATKSLQGILKKPGKIQSSPTFEKRQKPSSSL